MDARIRQQDLDFPKFVDLLTSRKIWLANAEVLAADDPFEGAPNAIQFPHRMWKTIDAVPENLRRQILSRRIRAPDETDQTCFKHWFMQEEQCCYMQKFGRRHYYVNCWHQENHESVAMWKIYASPGAGVAIITTGGRIDHSLSSNAEPLYLGKVKYQDPDIIEIGGRNSFDPLLIKRTSYSYEREVRLVLWDTRDFHDPLEKFSWNDEKMRFEDIIEDNRPINAGRLLDCDVETLIEKIIISPFAPAWYLSMINRLMGALRLEIPVFASKLLSNPSTIP